MNLNRTFQKIIHYPYKFTNPVKWKEFNELKYWKRKKNEEGQLSNEHYEHFYTTHFEFRREDYQDQVILDLGCGPRGSLEWAVGAARRIGLDPLAEEYLRLGADRHNMEYISAPSEAIPLADNTCDAVFAFNSLDHVDNVEKTVLEIKRIIKPGGIFLLIVEINHAPTKCEPHTLSPTQILELFTPEFTNESLKVYKPVKEGAYQSILAGEEFENPLTVTGLGWLTAKFIKTAP